MLDHGMLTEFLSKELYFYRKGMLGGLEGKNLFCLVFQSMPIHVIIQRLLSELALLTNQALYPTHKSRAEIVGGSAVNSYAGGGSFGMIVSITCGACFCKKCISVYVIKVNDILRLSTVFKNA